MTSEQDYDTLINLKYCKVYTLPTQWFSTFLYNLFWSKLNLSKLVCNGSILHHVPTNPGRNVPTNPGGPCDIWNLATQKGDYNNTSI
jgi:hypothetical protein